METLASALMLEGGGVVSLVGAGGKTSLMFRLAKGLSASGDTVLTTTTTRILAPDPSQSPHLVIADGAAGVLEAGRRHIREERHITAAAGRIGSQGKLRGFPPEVVDALGRSGMFRWILVEADGAAGRPLKAPAAHEPVVPAGSGWVVAVVGLSVLGKPLGERWVFRPQEFSRVSGLGPGAPVDADALARALAHPEGILKGAPEDCRRIVFLNQADCLEDIDAALAVGRALKRIGSRGILRVVCGRAAFAEPVAEVQTLDAQGGGL